MASFITYIPSGLGKTTLVRKINHYCMNHNGYLTREKSFIKWRLGVACYTRDIPIFLLELQHLPSIIKSQISIQSQIIPRLVDRLIINNQDHFCREVARAISVNNFDLIIMTDHHLEYLDNPSASFIIHGRNEERDMEWSKELFYCEFDSYSPDEHYVVELSAKFGREVGQSYFDYNRQYRISSPYGIYVDRISLIDDVEDILHKHFDDPYRVSYENNLRCLEVVDMMRCMIDESKQKTIDDYLFKGG